LTKQNPRITVFEHETLRKGTGPHQLETDQLKGLQHYYGQGVPYYDLVHDGVRFNQYVGVIQIGKTQIEVLPKADQIDGDETKWRNLLIGMLRVTGGFDIKATSYSDLKIKPNSILDLYFELFVRELEYLLQVGLIKQYRKKEGNVTALKGNLLFSRHIQQNVIHQERLYVQHTTYDIEHQLHYILLKALRLLQQINSQSALVSRIGSLLLHFPDLQDIKVTPKTFTQIVFNRKNAHYKKAIEIAEILLLQYHPDLSTGKNNVLALMFDMNKLWEKFVYVSLRKCFHSKISITAQKTKLFWQSRNSQIGTSQRATLQPDIVINQGTPNCLVLDTKWKNIGDSKPSIEDLRQMYAYSEYFGARQVALVYPGAKYHHLNGEFLPTAYPNNESTNVKTVCGIIKIAIPQTSTNVTQWQEEIGKRFIDLGLIQNLLK
jgi:5-methylcytosine-specific restriction enzyme subunit McrC